MTDTFRFPGRSYFLIAGVLVLGVLSAPFLIIESTRHGPVTSGEVILGIMPLFLVALLAVSAWQTLTVSVDEVRIARTFFGRAVRELRWDAIGSVEIGVLRVPTRKSGRLIVVRAVEGHAKISISSDIERFEQLVSRIAEFASRHGIEVEHDAADA